MKYKTGLIIGRFQPFHHGHLFLFREAFKQVENVIIGIGSVNVSNDKNPFPQIKIEQMIQKVIQIEGWEKKVLQMFGIPDVNDDEKWLGSIKSQATPFDVVISHNDWVTRIFREAKIPVIEVPFYKRDLYEGIKIRDLMKSGKAWKDRVPECIFEVLKDI